MVMSAPLRRALLTVHIVVAVGWLGAVAAYLVVDIVAATHTDPLSLRAAYLSMAWIARFLLVPIAFATFLTGVAVALGTAWGLFRHYWVVISLVLTAVALTVLLLQIPLIDARAALAADPTTTTEALRTLGSTLLHSAGGVVVLLVVLVLNLYKPRGMTRYGRRKQAGRSGTG